jgi:hypothetical protein
MWKGYIDALDELDEMLERKSISVTDWNIQCCIVFHMYYDSL